MNLGELIVELSLDSSQFAQELDAAKKRATEAAKAMENIFSKGFEIGIDDSALHDLNKHLNVKVQHLNEVNKYFKNNPITVHVDDDQLTELNKTLESLTRKKHVIEIEQRVKNIVQEDDLEDTVKKSVEKGVKDGVKEGVKDGFQEVDKLIEDIVREAVEAGVKSAKSSGGSSGSSGSSSGGFDSIADQIKAGFADIKDGSDRDYVSKAIEVILKPGQDLVTGFFEGFSNTFGTEISKSFIQTLGKTMNLNLSKAGEGLGIAFSKVMGVNVDKYKKESQKNQQSQSSNIQQGFGLDAQKTEKAVYNGTYSAAIAFKTTRAVVDLSTTAVAPLIGELLINISKGINNRNQLASEPSRVLITPPSQESQSSQTQQPNKPLPDLSQLKRYEELELIEVNLPQDTPQKLRQGLEAAKNSSKQIYKHFDEIKKNSQSTGKDSQQNTRSVADMVEEAKKLRTANSNYAKTMRNLIQSFTDLGEYNTVIKIGKDFGRSKKDAKAVVEKLKADAKAAGATPAEINAIGQALAPITQGEKAISKDVTKLVTTTYGKKQAKVLNEVPLMGEDVVNGLFKGLDGVEDIGEKTAQNFIKAFKNELGIRSPSILMVEMGLMVVSGLVLGLQKGDSRIAKGARKIVETLTNTLQPIKEIADPVLGAAGAVPALSSAATYGSAALNATDTGLKILTQIGKRHEKGLETYATADQTVFHAVGGSIKDLVTGIKSDATLTKPREAFDHVINITKAGALGLGVSPSAMTPFDAAQAGAAALLRNSAVMKAIVQSHGQARAMKNADPSLNYLATFKSILIDNLKGLKLSKGEVLKALGSAMKVVPTGIGTAAEGNFGIAGEVFSNAPDALVPVLDVYRKAKARKAQGESTKEAVASSFTELGLPSSVADTIGSAADKLNPQLKGFVKVGKNINEGISKGILNTVVLTTSAIENTGNAIQKRLKDNMRTSSPSKVMMDIGLMIVAGLAAGITKGDKEVLSATQTISNAIISRFNFDGLKNKFPRLASIVTNLIGGFNFSGLKDKFPNLTSIATNLISGFINGFLGQKDKINGLSAIFLGLISKIKSTLKIHSPSEETKAIGSAFSEGFEEGANETLIAAADNIAAQYTKMIEQVDLLILAQQKKAKKVVAQEIQKQADYSAWNEPAQEVKQTRGGLGSLPGEWGSPDELVKKYREIQNKIIQENQNQLKAEVRQTKTEQEIAAQARKYLEILGQQARQRVASRIYNPRNTSIPLNTPFNPPIPPSPTPPESPSTPTNPPIPPSPPWTQIIGDIFNDFLEPLRDNSALPLGEFLRKGFNNVFATLIKKFTPSATLFGGISRLFLDFFPSLRKQEGLGSTVRNMLPLVGTFMGGRGKVIGDWFSNILVSNNLIKPGFANNLIKSVTGINLGTTGQGWAGWLLNNILKGPSKGIITRLLFASLGLPAIAGGGAGVALSRFGILNAVNPITSFMTQLTGGVKGFAGTEESKRRGTIREVAERQIGVNIASVGLSQNANTQDLVQQILGTFYDSLTRESKNSPLMKTVIGNLRKVFVDGIAKSDFLSGLGQGGLGSRIFSSIGAYASGDVKGAIESASRLIKVALRGMKLDKILMGLGIKIDMQQIKNVMTAALLGISAFHRAFTEEGLGLGKALAKGFKEARNNVVNAVGDVQRGIDKELGRDDPQKIWQQIVTRWKQGVVSKDIFKDFWNAVGNNFKRSALKAVNPEDRDSMGENVLSFVTSIVAAFAPITTFATTLIPLVAPLIPVFGAIGGAIFMVRKQLQGLIQEMLVIEPMQRKLDFLGGSKSAGKREMQYSIDVSKTLGVPAKAAANAYGSMAVAARGTRMEGEGVRELFEGISASLSALGVTGQDADLVFMAYTQMLSKGKISMEELRQQLGEKFPPAMQTFAKAIGKSVPEMIDLASKGALLSDEVLPKVAKTLNMDYRSAAGGADGLSLALARLGTVGFEMNVKLTNAYSGLFAGIVNIFTSMAEVVNRNLDTILMFINSFLIGTAAVLGVGLTTIMQQSPIGNWIKNVSTLLTTGIGAAMAGLGPHFLGIIADIADDWFGAQHSIMENMYNGVSNMIVGLITLVDNAKRHFSGAGLFDVIMGDTKDSSFNVIKTGIQAISNIFNNFFGFLKPGMVELIAMVLMFEQFQTLFKTFLAPSIKNVGKGLYEIGMNFKDMITTALSPKGIGSLFTNLTGGDTEGKGAFSNTANARIAADIARTQASLGGYKYNPENVSIFQEVLQGVKNLATGILNKFKDLANFLLSPFNAALKVVSQGFNLIRSTMQGLATGTLTLRGAFVNIAQGLQTLKTNVLTNFRGIKQFIIDSFDISAASAKKAIMPFTALFSPDISVRRAVRKDWGNLFTSTISHFMGGIGLAFKHLGKLALEFGLALGVMFLARSDFSNPMETAINKASRGINASLLSIENSFTKMNKSIEASGKQAANTTKQLKSLADSIPSKGLQLDIAYVFGMKDEGYSTDDLAKRINKVLAGELKPEDLNFGERFVYENTRRNNQIRQQNKEPDSNPIWSFLTTPWDSEKKNYGNLELSQQQLGLVNKYPAFKSLIRETDAYLPKGVSDVLNSVASADKNIGTFKTELERLSLLDQAKYAEKMKVTISEIAKIDQQRFALMTERTKIEQQDPYSEKSIKRIGEIDKQLNKLNEARKDASKPIDENLTEIANMQKFVDELKKLDVNFLSAEQKQAFEGIIKQIETLINTAKKVVKESIPEDIFQSIFTATVGALKRFEQVFERFGKTVESASAKRQYLIYSNVNTPGDVDFASKQSAIIEAEDRLVGATAQYQVQDRAFKMLSIVPQSQQSETAKTQLEETRKNRLQAEVELNNAKGNLAKSRYDLNRSIIEQNRQIEEFIRNAEKETLGVKNEFEKAALDLKMMKMKTRVSESLTGVVDDGVVSFINSIVSVFEEINNAVKQQMDADVRIAELNFRRQEIQLENEKFRESLPSTDLMDLLVKTRADINLVAKAFADENKKFEDVGSKIVKQGQNIANNIEKANAQAQNLVAGLISVFGSSENVKLSTKEITNNLIDATKAAENLDKLFKSLGVTTSGEGGAKPVANNMSDANKDSKSFAQNINNLTSPLSGISNTVLQIRNSFRDSATYTAQIRDNVNNTNTNGKPSTLPGNTKLPTASNNNDNQYAINYGEGALMAGLGMGTSDIGIPMLLARRGETKQERGDRLFREYMGKDPKMVYAKVVQAAYSNLPMLQREMPEIGDWLIGKNYNTFTPDKQRSNRLDAIRSGTKSDLQAIMNSRHLIAIEKTINDLTSRPNQNDPRIANALQVLRRSKHLAQLNINEPLNSEGQDSPFRTKINFDELLKIPEFKAHNDKYHREHIVELRKYRNEVDNDLDFQADMKLAIYDGYKTSLRKRNPIDQIFGAVDPRRVGIRKFYDLQTEAKTLQNSANELGLSPQATITTPKPNVVSGSLPSVPKIEQNLQIPTTRKLDPKVGSTPLPQPQIPKEGTRVITASQDRINNLETQERTNINTSAITTEQVLQRLETAKNDLIKRRNELDLSKTNIGGVSNTINEARKDANALIQKFNADPSKVLQTEYEDNIASINRAIEQARINLDNSQRKLSGLQTFLEKGLPGILKESRQLIDRLPDGDAKNQALAKFTEIEQAQKQETLMLITQAENDIKQAQSIFDQLSTQKTKLQEGAKKIKLFATNKLDTERTQRIREFENLLSNNQIAFLKSKPDYQFDTQAQRDVAELEFQNAARQAETERENQKIRLLETGLSDPKFREGSPDYKTSLQNIEKAFQNAMQTASITRQTALYNAEVNELGKVAKDKLLASITHTSQFTNSLLDIEQFKQDKMRELRSSLFFAKRDEKGQDGKPTEEAIKQTREYAEAQAQLTTEVERRTSVLKQEEKRRVPDLLNNAKIAELEGIKGAGGNVYDLNHEIRRIKEQQALQAYEAAKNAIPVPIKPGLYSMPEERQKYPEERQKYQDEMEAARRAYQNELDNIRRTYEDLGRALANSSVTAGLQSLKDSLSSLVMDDIIIGFDGATGKTRDLSNELKGFERVLYNVTKAVLNAMTKILIEAAVNKLFGKGGWLDIGKAFGLAKGGIVPNYAEGGSVDGIGKAIQKERSQNGGIDPVLAVLTPGERVLTVAENRKFEALKLQRFLEPIAIMPEEMAYRKIQNYAMGGVVGSSADSSIQINNTYAKEQPSNSTTINVPVTVENNGNSNDSQIDANSLQNAVRSAVLTEIQRQQRIGGILRK